MLLKDLPANARPREKMLSLGPSALSDAELLALLLRTGLPGKNVLQLAEELLNIKNDSSPSNTHAPSDAIGSNMPSNTTAKRLGGISALLHAGADDLKRIKGLGPAKRSELMAVLELARRAIAQRLQEGALLNDPSSVRQYVQMHIANLQHEVFAVLFLDAQHRLLAMEELFRGTLTQTSVYPREVVIRALHHHAAAVILAHNHPSGSVQPSRADEALTHTLKAALALVDVRVLDHIIVAPGASASLAEQGLL
ncbi:DNA repair protein RadC [Curvibacter sp. CHRR-16]|uniref:RadC family protein n=1 Tax=Curvibacter sp. CHRR-16 TaxID=2835872 RepID=UPI001BDB3CFB|nr:DNA repair protein RadC [Curvibacter sp. CHRR-16]MBT0569186.1 DNA repair protein RadC [Curvibacter sp. CHRR-16]